MPKFKNTDGVESHKVGSREEWLAARKKLLTAEKELTRRSDEGDCHGFCAEKQK